MRYTTLLAAVFTYTISAMVCSAAETADRAAETSQAIDRKALVERHNITFTEVNLANVPQVGNGGLLYAVAMMAAGWDGGPDTNVPGFPDDGSWIVRHEGLMKAQ